MLDQHRADHLAADQGRNAGHVAFERAADLAGHQVVVAAAALVRAPAADRHAGLRIDVVELQLAVRAHGVRGSRRLALLLRLSTVVSAPGISCSRYPLTTLYASSSLRASCRTSLKRECSPRRWSSRRATPLEEDVAERAEQHAEREDQHHRKGVRGCLVALALLVEVGLELGVDRAEAPQRPSQAPFDAGGTARAWPPPVGEEQGHAQVPPAPREPALLGDRGPLVTLARRRPASAAVSARSKRTRASW